MERGFLSSIGCPATRHSCSGHGDECRWREIAGDANGGDESQVVSVHEAVRERTCGFYRKRSAAGAYAPVLFTSTHLASFHLELSRVKHITLISIGWIILPSNSPPMSCHPCPSPVRILSFGLPS